MGDRQSRHALKVNQWLLPWNEVEFDPERHRSRPPNHFYLFSLPASVLRRLAGIDYRRADISIPRTRETGIQRRHDPSRSAEIAEYVRHGFPWSDLTKQQRATGKFNDLKMPGWLPTAVVVNIRADSDSGAHQDHRITIQDFSDGTAAVTLPQIDEGELPSGTLAPIQVIDGQHRLWAFDPSDSDDSYELPVVAFSGLDITWQAYLFYTINIKPKRISTSLAFDLYPILRTEEWLQRFEGPTIYREARAQELTAALWSHEESPWRDRINMLGEGRRGVSQAAWIRSLTNTLIRAYEGRGVRGVGGLFGAPVGSDDLTLPWSRAQQAGLLVYYWRSLDRAMHDNVPVWYTNLQLALRAEKELAEDYDWTLGGRYSLLNTDQGVRAALYALNDFVSIAADQLQLDGWLLDDVDEELRNQDIRAALNSLQGYWENLGSRLDEIAHNLAAFDWRTAAAPGLTEEEKTEKLGLKGSSGYRELRRRLYYWLAESSSSLADDAQELIALQGLE